MDLKELILHPEKMNKETLYELRSLTALHPYYQTARLLMLQNLYLLHDSSFDDELHRAALFITDRTKLFDLVEAGHYQQPRQQAAQPTRAATTAATTTPAATPTPPAKPGSRRHRKPTATDATVDYAAYLLEADSDTTGDMPAAPMRGQSLIDKFIDDEGGKIQLQAAPEYTPATPEEATKGSEEGYFTATLARIYVKQGRYSKALEIIKRLNLNYPKKSAYFADQIPFLERLTINN